MAYTCVQAPPRRSVRRVRQTGRIASAIVAAMPTPMSTSPMLKTFANGSQAGSAKMSVSGAKAGSGTTDAVRVAVPEPADRRERGRVGRHPAAVGDDGREVAAGSDRDQRDARHVACCAGRPRRRSRSRRRRPPDRRRRRARPTASVKIATWIARPSSMSGTQRRRSSPSRPRRPPASRPTTMPIGMAYRMNTAESPSRRSAGGGRVRRGSSRAGRRARRGGRR